MRMGTLVRFTNEREDKRLVPKQKIGFLLSEVNEVGKVKVCFGSEIMWVWSGDLELVSGVKK